MLIPQTLVKKGRGRSRREDGERRGGGCVMAVVTRIALQHLYLLDPPGKLYAFSFSPVKSPGVSMR